MQRFVPAPCVRRCGRGVGIICMPWSGQRRAWPGSTGMEGKWRWRPAPWLSTGHITRVKVPAQTPQTPLETLPAAPPAAHLVQPPEALVGKGPPQHVHHAGVSHRLPAHPLGLQPRPRQCQRVGHELGQRGGKHARAEDDMRGGVVVVLHGRTQSSDGEEGRVGGGGGMCAAQGMRSAVARIPRTATGDDSQPLAHRRRGSGAGVATDCLSCTRLHASAGCPTRLPS